MSDGNGLPNGWTEVALDLLGPISGGGTPSKSNPSYWTGGTVPWVSPKDMKSFEIADAQDKITSAAVSESSTKMVPAGSVLVVIRSGILQHTVPVGVTTCDVALNQDMKAIIPHNGINSTYVAYALLASQSEILNECCKDGTTVQSIEIPRFRRLGIPVAPEREQTRIADRIDELFTDLAAGVMALERVQKKLKRYRSAVLHAAVTGRLTEKWREGNGPPAESGEQLLERLLVERRRQWEERTLADYEAKGKKPPKNWQQRYKEPVEPKTDELPELPEGWCWASMDQCVSVITSGSRDWSPFYGSGSGTFIMAQNVRMGRLDRSYRQAVDPPADHRDRRRSQVNVDDLLVTIVGANTGDVCRIDEELPEHYVCQSVALMRPVIGPIAPWLEAWFTAPSGAQAQFSKVIYGAGRPHLSFEQLETTSIALPPIAEQELGIEAAEEYVSHVEAMATEVERGLARAGRLRQAILKAAFTGDLVPQDPKDEPASVLLERIHAEREAFAAEQKPRKKATRRKAAPKKTTKKKARKS